MSVNTGGADPAIEVLLSLYTCWEDHAMYPYSCHYGVLKPHSSPENGFNL